VEQVEHPNTHYIRVKLFSMGFITILNLSLIGMVRKCSTVPPISAKPYDTTLSAVEQVVTLCSTSYTRRYILSITLRPYQVECINSIPLSGSYLIQMATGLGKTVTFANIPRKGKMLILSHREELVRQPLKYFDCQCGVEMAGSSATPLDEVVSASVQTLTRRLNRFDPDEFDIIITDEAHHAAARSYRRIYDYFRPRLHLGFTATPNRGDKVRLDDIFQDILFQRDLKWGIQNMYLSDIYCRRVNIGYDLRSVRTTHGDYAPGELEEAMDGTADAIAEIYEKMAEGATLIFAVSVKHANDIAAKIPGAVVVTGETPNRAEIVKSFTDGKIKCIVNVMVFTEGTDIPRVETIIIARPTQSDALYTQMVGRGLRMYPGKRYLNLIDCVGITGKASLCTAPSLLGINLDDVPERKASEVQGMLLELPIKAAAAADCPESWIKNIQIVDLWAAEQKYQTHDVNWFKMPDGSFVCSLLERQKICIPAQDELGRTLYNGELMPMQKAFDEAYKFLCEEYEKQRYIWDLNSVRRWGKSPASDKQLAIIKRRCKGFEADGLSKMEASMILNRLLHGGKAS
jgi:superfamily II DNA or RNA helicase